MEELKSRINNNLEIRKLWAGSSDIMTTVQRLRQESDQAIIKIMREKRLPRFEFQTEKGKIVATLNKDGLQISKNYGC